MDPRTKRKYNLSFKARKHGIRVNGYSHIISIYFSEIPKLILVKEAVILIRDYDFRIVENRQLKLNLK